MRRKVAVASLGAVLTAGSLLAPSTDALAASDSGTVGTGAAMAARADPSANVMTASSFAVTSVKVDANGTTVTNFAGPQDATVTVASTMGGQAQLSSVSVQDGVLTAVSDGGGGAAINRAKAAGTEPASLPPERMAEVLSAATGMTPAEASQAIPASGGTGDPYVSATNFGDVCISANIGTPNYARSYGCGRFTKDSHSVGGDWYVDIQMWMSAWVSGAPIPLSTRRPTWMAIYTSLHSPAFVVDMSPASSRRDPSPADGCRQDTVAFTVPGGWASYSQTRDICQGHLNPILPYKDTYGRWVSGANHSFNSTAKPYPFVHATISNVRAFSPAGTAMWPSYISTTFQWSN